MLQSLHGSWPHVQYSPVFVMRCEVLHYSFLTPDCSPLPLGPPVLRPPFLSHAKHTLISGSWCLQFRCLECSSPQVSAWAEPLLLSSVCSPSREAFSNHSKKEPPRHHYPPSVFFTAITRALFVCLLPLERTRHNSVVLTACPRHREQCGGCSARMCWVTKVIFFSLQHGTNSIIVLQTF